MKTFLESVIDICLMTLWTSGRWKVSLSTFWHLGKTMMSILCSLDFFLSWEETYMRGNYVSLYLICTWFLSCAISSVKMVCLCVAWCEGWECELLMKKALDSNHSYMESRPGSSISWWGWGGVAGNENGVDDPSCLCDEVPIKIVKVQDSENFLVGDQVEVMQSGYLGESMEIPSFPTYLTQCIWMFICILCHILL